MGSVTNLNNALHWVLYDTDCAQTYFMACIGAWVHARLRACACVYHVALWLHQLGIFAPCLTLTREKFLHAF